MPSCTVSACISALAVTPSSPNLHMWTGHSCLHTSCFAHLGISVKTPDCAELAALHCLHANVNPPLHSPFKMCPKCPRIVPEKDVCGPCQQPKEIMAENRLSPKIVVWVSDCPDGQPALLQSLTHLCSSGTCLLLSWFLCCAWKSIIKCYRSRPC